MELAEKILSMADENGFDWWGKKHEWITGFSFYFVGKNITLEVDDAGYGSEYHYSLAELATNKSFLEAMALSRYGGKQYGEGVVILQPDLIKDLTNTGGENFWTICAEFIGLDNKFGNSERKGE